MQFKEGRGGTQEFLNGEKGGGTQCVWPIILSATTGPCIDITALGWSEIITVWHNIHVLTNVRGSFQMHVCSK